MVSELSKIAIIHLFLLGYNGEDLVDFELKLANSSIIAEQQHLELWRTKLEIAGSAQEGVFDREFIWKRIFKLSDEEIDQIREGKKFDKIEDLYLEQVQLPGMDTGVPEGEVGGEEELPATLGGEPPTPGGTPPTGGEEAPPEGAETPSPENAGVTRDGDVVGERTNPGSSDPLGTKQAPFRKTENPVKLASATPQFHNARHGHKPSARDPMQVFKRVARGHISAEAKQWQVMLEGRDLRTETLADMEHLLEEILQENSVLKKRG
jgi:hypothetical protein